MSGLWELVRIGKPGDRQISWILFKKRDAYARAAAEYDVVSALPDSVLTSMPGAAAAPPLPPAEKQKRAPKAGPTRSAALGVKAALPDKLGPQLATLSNGVPISGDWSFEIKFDGYRVMARIDHGVPRLRRRCTRAAAAHWRAGAGSPSSTWCRCARPRTA